MKPRVYNKMKKKRTRKAAYYERVHRNPEYGVAHDDNNKQRRRIKAFFEDEDERRRK